MIFKRKARAGIVVMAFAGALTAGAVMSSPASAAQAVPSTALPATTAGAPTHLPAPGHSVVITAHRVASGRGQGATPSSMPSSISCTITSAVPTEVMQDFDWGPFEAPVDSVGGYASTRCTYPVQRIQTTVSLYFNQGLRFAGPTFSTVGSSVGQGWALTGCEEGYWNTYGQLMVYWPGYQNTTGSATSLSGAFADYSCDNGD